MTRRTEQLPLARSPTQNPGAPMKQGCANLAQIHVATIEPSRSNLTFLWLFLFMFPTAGVYEIVADYVLNMTWDDQMNLLIHPQLQAISLKKKMITNNILFLTIATLLFRSTTN